MLTLNNIQSRPGATHRKKRIGRGTGSGHGTTATKGDKGQRARAGRRRPAVGFEGGQTPLYRRLPKRGFTSLDRTREATYNLGDLESRLPGDIAEVSIETLRGQRLLKGRYDRLIILGNGELKRPLKFKVHRVSPSAQAKIEKSGGSIELIPPPVKFLRPSKKKKA